MPRYGFNFQWIIDYHGPDCPPLKADERALDFMAAQGFNFARIPASYWHWTRDFDYFHPNEDVFLHLDGYLKACRERGIHMCLSLHRAPGYCINQNELERHNLWRDEIAQDAFTRTWELFARRYKGITPQQLSFDLVNEPPNPGEYGMTREIHAALIRRVTAAIRAIDPEREIVIDGLGGGHLAMPELANLGVIHSGRGYQPMPVSHQGAAWWPGHATAPAAQYPGVEWEGRTWNRAALRDFYQPWRQVEAAGARIHIGECGCFNRTPNEMALRWLGDLFGLFGEFGWGYSLWQFEGAFGLAAHGRPGAVYDTLGGYQVDRQLLEILRQSQR